MNRALFPLIAIILLTSCATINPTHDETLPLRITLSRLLPPLTPLSTPPKEGPLADYARTTLTPEEYPDLTYLLGTIPAGPHTLCVHLFHRHTHSRGTVLVLHGYATDSSLYGALARTLIEEGWDVVLVDLPGHGLSTGERGAAWPDFSIYGDIVQHTLNALSPYLHPPLAAIGHSTGALALIDHSLRYPSPFFRLILFAPLIHTRAYSLLSTIHTLTTPFIRQVRALSHTPLGLRIFPLSWFERLKTWEARTRSVPRIPTPPTLLILAGGDTVVDNEYNRTFLQERLPILYTALVPTADHFELDSGSPDPEVLSLITSFLGRGPAPTSAPCTLCTTRPPLQPLKTKRGQHTPTPSGSTTSIGHL
ncbi:alpha/beta hydrolase [Spirochaeta thermophila]|nr:alpha/beta fold hydrolase [Spirochaeta thermophila]